MVSRKTARERAKLRRHNEQLVRRSPILTNGAKLLWLELSAWAWDDPTCYPKQDLLVMALNKERSTISRWATELKKHKLLTINRQRGGNEYVLAEEVPYEVCDPARGFNKNLVRLLRDVAEMPHPEAEGGSGMCVSGAGDVAEMPHDSQGDVAEMPHSDVAELPHPSSSDEVSTDEVRTEEKRSRSSEVKSRSRSATPTRLRTTVSSGASARSARAHEGSATNEKQRTYVSDSSERVDPSELMEDPQPKTQHRKTPRKRRGPDSALVTQQGNGLRNAGKPVTGSKTVEVGSPPPWEPEDVLAALRGEIEEKYGANAIRKIPLNLSGADRGKLRRAILAKYSPDVVLAMVRVLVWDWEIARATCFPYRTQVNHPTVEALVQYQETLASAIDSGLNYDGGFRGEWNTYAKRYLKKPTAEDPPF